MTPHPPTQRLRRALWSTAAFLVGFAILQAVVVVVYLIPAADAAKNADEPGRRQLAAYSSLLLAVLLFVIGVGLMFTFRVHRFFFPSHYAKQTPSTPHSSAWEIAGQRMQVPPADELED